MTRVRYALRLGMTRAACPPRSICVAWMGASRSAPRDFEIMNVLFPVGCRQCTIGRQRGPCNRVICGPGMLALEDPALARLCTFGEALTASGGAYLYMST
jgi:hypothetical protein